ncbi:MAG: hypothetical protein ABSB70_01355 [Candidatus Velthaea sp.]
MRARALTGTASLGSHQFNAHLNLAFATQSDIEPWELYESPRLFMLPRTRFYTEHASLIIEAIAQSGECRGLLARVGREKQDFEQLAHASRLDLIHDHHHRDRIMFYDPNGFWADARGVNVLWYDRRERFREIVNDGPDWMGVRMKARRQRLQTELESPSMPKRSAGRAEIAGIDAYLPGDLFASRVRSERSKWPNTLRYLELLDATPDFNTLLQAIVRRAENRVRSDLGLPKIGEGWISETELLYRVKRLASPREVQHGAQFRWLGRQHLDIYVPDLAIGFEYQRVQHYRAIDFFGGEAAFRKSQERDACKRKLCRNNGVQLIEIPYDQDPTDEALRAWLGV